MVEPLSTRNVHFPFSSTNTLFADAWSGDIVFGDCVVFGEEDVDVGEAFFGDDDCCCACGDLCICGMEYDTGDDTWTTFADVVVTMVCCACCSFASDGDVVTVVSLPVSDDVSTSTDCKSDRFLRFLDGACISPTALLC